MALPETRQPVERTSPTGRVLLSSPVVVYGWGADQSAFHAQASILSLNTQGGVLELAANVQRGQTILLMNETTKEDCACRVVFVGVERTDGRRKVVFEF